MTSTFKYIINTAVSWMREFIFTLIWKRYFCLSESDMPYIKHVFSVIHLNNTAKYESVSLSKPKATVARRNQFSSC